MKVRILKTHNKFQMSVQHQGIIYNKKNKEKILLKKEQNMELPLEELKKKPVVFIKTIVDRIEIKFSKFIDEFIYANLCQFKCNFI